MATTAKKARVFIYTGVLSRASFPAIPAFGKALCMRSASAFAGCAVRWLTVALLVALPVSAQMPSAGRRASGNLTVTLTVVPSTSVIVQPDGSTKTVVANAYANASPLAPPSPPEISFSGVKTDLTPIRSVVAPAATVAEPMQSGVPSSHPPAAPAINIAH